MLPWEGWHRGLGGCAARHCPSSSRETVWRETWGPLLCSEDLRATSPMRAPEKGLGHSLRQLQRGRGAVWADGSAARVLVGFTAGQVFSGSEATRDPKLSALLAPSPPGLVGIAHLPLGPAVPGPQAGAGMCSVGWDIGRTKTGPRWGVRCYHDSMPAPRRAVPARRWALPVPATGRGHLHLRPQDLGRGEGPPASSLLGEPAPAFVSCGPSFPLGLIKDLELFTACGWLFIWVRGSSLLP